jgi:hypothetical protein
VAFKSDMYVALHWMKPFIDGDVDIRIKIETGTTKAVFKANKARVQKVYKGLQSIMNVISICLADSVPYHMTEPAEIQDYLSQGQAGTGSRKKRSRTAPPETVFLFRTNYLDMSIQTVRSLFGHDFAGKAAFLRKHVAEMISMLYQALSSSDFSQLKDHSFALPPYVPQGDGSDEG